MTPKTALGMEFGTSDGARQKRRTPATKQKGLSKKNAMIELIVGTLVTRAIYTQGQLLL